MYSAWFRSTFLRALKFLEIKERGPNFLGEPILQNVWIIWSPLLYLNLKSFSGPNSSPFIRFQCILYDSGVFLSGFPNLYKLKRGDLISGRNEFCRMSELFGPPSLFQSSKFYGPKFFVVHCISMYYAWFRSTFVKVLKFQIKEGGPTF